jgi:hypothetical protein
VNGDQSSGAFLFLGTQNSRRSSLTKSLKPDSEWAGFQRSTVTGTVWILDAHRDGKRFLVRADEILTAFLDTERAIHQFAVSLFVRLSPLSEIAVCLWELDILWHSIRKLRTYEEIHTVFTRYLRGDGVYRFLSAGGNDRYGRTR